MVLSNSRAEVFWLFCIVDEVIFRVIAQERMVGLDLVVRIRFVV